MLSTKEEKEVELSSAVTYDVILALMGPTFPSSVLEETRDVILHYPGVTFLFKYELPLNQDLEFALSNASLSKLAIYSTD